MTCELMKCCRFFKDSMKNLPRTAEYIQHKLCLGDFEACNRYRAYKQLGKGKIPYDLCPFEADEIKKVMECLKKGQLQEA
jgi:hypothetical protein